MTDGPEGIIDMMMQLAEAGWDAFPPSSDEEEEWRCSVCGEIANELINGRCVPCVGAQYGDDSDATDPFGDDAQHDEGSEFDEDFRPLPF